MNNPTTDSINRQGSIATQVGQTGKMALIVIASSLLFTPAAQAFEVKVSGQVSRMVIIPDDAEGDEIQHVDIGWSGSRFRFTGSEEMDNGNKVGFRFEIQARSNSTANASVDGGNLGSINGDDFRYQDLYLTADWGKISFGKGDGAANGSTEVDFSGTALSSSSNHQDNWGNFKIRADTDTGTTTTPSTTLFDPTTGLPIDVVTENDNTVAWKEVFTMFDGLSRQNRVRYDTPNFNGFSFAGSLNQGNATELAVRYKGDLFGGKLGAAFFVATAPDISATVDGNDITGGSASLLLKSGLNFTVAISESEPDVGAETDATTFKLGYKMGKHAFAVDVGEGENGAGEEGDTTGFTWAYFPHPGVEIFATVRELDSDNIAGAESVDLVAFGSRIKF